MVDDEEVKKAKALLKSAGYYVVPREKMLVLGANRFVDHLTICRYGDERGFVEAILKDMHVMMGVEMMKSKVCSLTMDEDPSHAGGSGLNYRLRATVIPYDMVSDPLLDFMREKQ